MPLDSRYSPSELLNGLQIRSKLDTSFPVHAAQGRHAKAAFKSQSEESTRTVSRISYLYKKGATCFALYGGPRSNKKPRWVPAIVTKVHDTKSVNVRVIPSGPVWRRHRPASPTLLLIRRH